MLTVWLLLARAKIIVPSILVWVGISIAADTGHFQAGLSVDLSRYLNRMILSNIRNILRNYSEKHIHQQRYPERYPQ
jgi:hypothetical protein